MTRVIREFIRLGQLNPSATPRSISSRDPCLSYIYKYAYSKKTSQSEVPGAEVCFGEDTSRGQGWARQAGRAEGTGGTHCSGEGPSCLFQLLGSPGPLGHVAPSLCVVPHSPRGPLPLSVCLTCLPAFSLQGHSPLGAGPLGKSRTISSSHDL